MKAIWNNTIIAESDQTIVVEGNNYFPPDAIKKEYFQPAKRIQLAVGKAKRAITTLSSTAK